jgi:hypothetical protein
MPCQEQDGNALRNRALEGLGVSFDAPFDVGLYLFDDDLAIVENSLNREAECELRIDGWARFDKVLDIPVTTNVRVSGGLTAEISLPPHSLVALKRAGR